MDIIPKEIVLAAAQMAKLDGLLPEQTMVLVFRALDHEISPDGRRKINPARTLGIGKAIYAALFDYPFDLTRDNQTANGWCWNVQIPEYGYGPIFEQLFIQAQLTVGTQRLSSKIYQHTLRSLRHIN
ncbi:hypothetical protein [Chitinibacter sp. S2-10]|uniref:hypothetical protein n=1 Tax=Chitinibacter sp. S2-10 TaxID=3373597 RepID=UPI00397764DF